MERRVISAWLGEISRSCSPPTLKRRAESTQPATRPQKRRRTALCNTSGNFVMPPKAPSTPAKRKSTRNPPPPPQHPLHDYSQNIFETEQQTPRASHYVRVLDDVASARIVLRPVPSLDGASDGGASDISDMSKKSGKSSVKRPPSPVKRLADLRMAERSLKHIPFDRSTMSDDVRQLYSSFLPSSNGVNVIPAAIKEEAMQWIEDRGTEMLFPHNFAPASKPSPSAIPVTDSHVTRRRSVLGIWDEILTIRNSAWTCASEDAPEAEWNELVHGSLLRLAVYRCGHHPSVGVRNITTARIQPRTLVPLHISGAIMESKLVDYGIFLLLNDNDKASVRALLRDDDSTAQSINQTLFDPLRECPLAVSVETKRAVGDTEAATVQLTTWAYAQITRWRGLVARRRSAAAAVVKLPPLPLVSVAGHEWMLFIAEDDAERTLLHGPLCFGDTRQILGIYKVLAGLQVLAEWVEGWFAEWVRENLLEGA